MKPIIIKTLFLLLWIVSPSFGGVAVDSLNPKQFIQLFTRSREGMEPTNSDALIGYIRPSTNVWISFDKEMMKKCIHPKENNFKELGHLNDSLNSIRKKRDDLQAAALAQNDMAKAEELGRVYKEKIDSILTKIEHLGMWSTEISITIIARLTLHSGTM
jgi:hypothetical protein